MAGRGISRALSDVGGGTLAVVAAVLAAAAAASLLARGTATSPGSPLPGLASAALAAGAAACISELRRRRTGAPFLPTFGRALLAASAAGFAGLLAGFAWGVHLYCAVGVDAVHAGQMGLVPPFGMLAALLLAGACLALGPRGRAAAYAASAALASAGIAAYVRFFTWFNMFDLVVTEGNVQLLDLPTALRACAVGLAPQLAALALGLALALWMEVSARGASEASGYGDG